MKCAKCNEATNWDSSYGQNNYFICDNCFQEMVQEIKKHNKKAPYPELIALKQICEQSKI